ncbi:MAG: tetratricopeptide repeat protein, partial [Planctomycetota bacterium]
RYSSFFIYFFFFILLFPVLEGSEYLKLGDIACREGKFEDARDAYRQAIVENPKNVAAHLALGHALFALGEYKYAFIEIRTGLEMHAYPQKIYPNLRDYYSSDEIFFNKLKKLQKYLQKRPNDKSAQFVYGYVCYYSGFKRIARKVFLSLIGQPYLERVDRKWVQFYLLQLSEEKILSKSPVFIEAIQNFKAANYLGAHKNLLRIIYEQPSLGIPPLFLAHTFFALNYYKLAYRYLERGIFFRPHNRILNALWWKYYKNKGEWLRLLIGLESHVSSHPKDFEAKVVLLFMYYAFRKYVSAKELLAQLESENKKTYTLPVISYLLTKKLGTLLPKKNEEQESHPTNQKILPQNPSPTLTEKEKFVQKLWKLGKKYLLEKDFDAALLAYQSLMKQSPVAYYLAGFAYFGKGKYPYGGDLIREGIVRTKGKNMPHILDYFRDVDSFFHRKRKLEIYLQDNPSDNLAQLLLAFLEYQLGKRDRAKKILYNLVTRGEERASLILLRRIQNEESQESKSSKNDLSKGTSSAQKNPQKKTGKPNKSKVIIQAIQKIQGKLPKALAQKKGRPKYIFEIEGKKYPVYLVGNQKYLFYKGRFYLLISKEQLKPFSPQYSMELPWPLKVQKELEKKESKKEALKLDQLLTPARPKWILRPNQPLWIPSKGE